MELILGRRKPMSLLQSPEIRIDSRGLDIYINRIEFVVARQNKSILHLLGKKIKVSTRVRKEKPNVFGLMQVIEISQDQDKTKITVA